MPAAFRTPLRSAARPSIGRFAHRQGLGSVGPFGAVCAFCLLICAALCHDVLSSVRGTVRGTGSRMTDALEAESSRAQCWLDAFPWLEAAAEEGAIFGGGLPWWREPIDPPDTGQRADRLARVSSLALERRGRWTIGQIFPGLPAETWLLDLPLTTRARNALGRFGYLRASDLQSVELADMLDWPHVGVGTIDSILQALADSATSKASALLLPLHDFEALSHRPALVESRPDVPSWALSLIEDLELIASWHATVGVPERSLLGGPLGAGTPSAVLGARQRLERLTAADVLDEEQSGPDAAELFERALTALDARAVEILTRRVFSENPETLDQIGRALGVTRERVRQLEAKARASLVELLRPGGPLEAISSAARGLIGTQLPLRNLLDLLPALARQVPSVQQPAWRVLDRLDDALEIEDAWCASPTVLAARTATQTRLQELANPYGVVRLDDIGPVNPNIPYVSHRDALAAWLAYCGYTIDGDYVLTQTQSVGDRAASILSIAGTPMSSQELLDRFGVVRSLGSLRNAMSIDERFERVDRDRWALAEWGHAAYTGIRALVRDEVARAGGRIPMETLIEHITGTYSVTASSVVAYASAPPFEAQGGIVRVATSGQSVRKTPERTRRLYRRGDTWLYRIRVTKDHLRGSGSVAPIAIASILGLQFGETRLLDSALGPQTVNWTGNQPAFGTIRRFLLANDIEVDQEVFLVIGDRGRFAIESIRPLAGDAIAEALTLIGADEGCDSAKAALAAAIGLPESTATLGIIAGYRERGDGEIADLLVAARDRLEEVAAPRRPVPEAEIDEILDLL